MHHRKQNQLPVKFITKQMDPNRNIVYHDDINKNYKEIWKRMWLKNNCAHEFQSLLAVSTGNHITSKIIMDICEEYKLSSQILFAAIDNYDLFFVKEFVFLKMKFLKIGNIPRDKIWLAIYETIKRDFLLHIISVIQIVVKQIDKNMIIPMSMIETTFSRLNLTYDKAEIVKSEFIVFQMLNFKVITSVSYDTIEFLVQNCLTVFTANTVHFRKTCMLVLQYAYLKWDIIYENLPGVLKADKVLFGAAVILATAVRFKFPVIDLQHLVKLICENVPNTESDLECLATSILKSGLA